MTLPKLRLVGFALSCPTAAVPEPETGTLSVALDASDVTVRVPLDVPVVVGANSTLKPAVCPAAKLEPEVIPLSVNPAPLIATFETETLEPPVLVTVPESVCFFPTVTLPKLIEARLDPSAPGVAWMPVPPALRPWQAARKLIAASSRRVTRAFEIFGEQYFLSFMSSEETVTEVRWRWTGGRLIPSSFAG